MWYYFFHSLMKYLGKSSVPPEFHLPYVLTFFQCTFSHDQETSYLYFNVIRIRSRRVCATLLHGRHTHAECQYRGSVSVRVHEPRTPGFSQMLTHCKERTREGGRLPLRNQPLLLSTYCSHGKTPAITWIPNLEEDLNLNASSIIC